MNERTKSRNESGIVIILMAVLLLVFLALILLVVGTTYMATSRNRLQSAVNLAAYAAIEEFVNRGGGEQYATNANLARQKANRVLAENRLPGVASAMGDLRLSDEPNPPSNPGGVIQFGTWIRDYPGYPTAPCQVSGQQQCLCGTSPESYPCFRANDNPMPTTTTFANAIRITAYNQSSNPLRIPLARIWGQESFALTASATVTLVQRCTALLMDIGKGSTVESHNTKGYGRAMVPGVTPPDPMPAGQFWPNPQIAQPLDDYDYGLLAIKQSEVSGVTQALCGALGETSTLATTDQVIWCNLNRANRLNRGSNTDARKHFRSDYKLVNSPAGQLWIKYYTRTSGPNPFFIAEPFSRYFLAFNAALRLLQTQASGADLNVLIAYRGAINPATDRWPENSGLTADTGILAQLTNILNIGTSEGAPARHPNFVDKLWVPLASSSPTIWGNNLPMALVSAIADLATCPAAARKSIIVATDGIPSCSYAADFTTQTFGPPVCGANYNRYLEAESQILTSIIPELQKRRIAVTSIWQGFHTDVNFINRKVNGRFIDLTEASAYGYGGLNADEDHKIFNYSNFPSESPCVQPNPDCNTPGTQCYASCTANADVFAYFNNGLTFNIAGTDTPVYFRRANGLMGKLSIDTGGIACPLLPLCQDGSPQCGGGTCYIDDPDNPGGPKILNPDHRQENQPQRCAVREVSMTQQAADCALRTVGSAPYILVEEGN